MNLYRSLSIKPNESLLKILERLAGEGYLQQNRQFKCNVRLAQLFMKFDRSHSSCFFELICSMKNLEELNLFGYTLTPDILAHLFQSCFKLVQLNIGIHNCKTLEMDERLKDQLKTGFQKLRCLKLGCSIDKVTWPVIQEILT